MSNPPHDHDSHPTEPLDLSEGFPPAEDADAAAVTTEITEVAEVSAAPDGSEVSEDAATADDDAVSEDDADTLPIPILPELAPQASPAVGAHTAPYEPEPEREPDAEPTKTPKQPKASKPKRRRRGGLITVIVLVVVVVAGVAAWFAGDAWARQEVVSVTQEKTREVFGLPEDHEVTVRTSGLLLPQLLAGSLNKLTIMTDDVPMASAAADVRIEATDVATYGDPSVGSATARIILPAGDAERLLTTSAGLSVVGAELASPNVTLEYSRDHFLSRVQVAVTLQPSVSGGQLVLTPTMFDVAGTPTTPEEVRDNFGGIAPPMLESRTLCVAGVLPKALTLTGVTVRGDAVDFDTDVDPRVIDDPALRETGSCG